MEGTEPGDLSRKLNLKAGMTIRLIEKPKELELPGIEDSDRGDADAVIAFIRKLTDVKAVGMPVIEAAKADRVAWFIYPKAGQLTTDLNRDILWQHLLERGIQGVRQISIDEVWSAMRFRPKK